MLSKDTTTHSPSSALPGMGDHHPFPSPLRRTVAGGPPAGPHARRFGGDREAVPEPSVQHGGIARPMLLSLPCQQPSSCVGYRGERKNSPRHPSKKVLPPQNEPWEFASPTGRSYADPTPIRRFSAAIYRATG